MHLGNDAGTLFQERQGIQALDDRFLLYNKNIYRVEMFKLLQCSISTDMFNQNSHH